MVVPFIPHHSSGGIFRGHGIESDEEPRRSWEEKVKEEERETKDVLRSLMHTMNEMNKMHKSVLGDYYKKKTGHEIRWPPGEKKVVIEQVDDDKIKIHASTKWGNIKNEKSITVDAGSKDELDAVAEKLVQEGYVDSEMVEKLREERRRIHDGAFEALTKNGALAEIWDGEYIVLKDGFYIPELYGAYLKKFHIPAGMQVKGRHLGHNEIRLLPHTKEQLIEGHVDVPSEIVKLYAEWLHKHLKRGGKIKRFETFFSTGNVHVYAGQDITSLLKSGESPFGTEGFVIEHPNHTFPAPASEAGIPILRKDGTIELPENIKLHPVITPEVYLELIKKYPEYKENIEEYFELPQEEREKAMQELKEVEMGLAEEQKRNSRTFREKIKRVFKAFRR
jgi:hypothetical protein